MELNLLFLPTLFHEFREGTRRNYVAGFSYSDLSRMVVGRMQQGEESRLALCLYGSDGWQGTIEARGTLRDPTIVYEGEIERELLGIRFAHLHGIQSILTENYILDDMPEVFRGVLFDLLSFPLLEDAMHVEGLVRVDWGSAFDSRMIRMRYDGTKPCFYQSYS